MTLRPLRKKVAAPGLIESLAYLAHEIIDGLRWNWRGQHGFEVAEGFFILYNNSTGQSKTVLYHPESGFVFKYDYEGIPARASRRYIGEVEMLDTVFRIRLPEYYVFPLEADYLFITAQEYVYGDDCGCENGGWCQHADAVRDATNCDDAHNGNWKFQDGEIILFDFETLNL